MIILETNQQLNIFSRIYLEKTKKDIIIEKYKPIIIVAGEPNSIFLKFFEIIKIKIKAL